MRRIVSVLAMYLAASCTASPSVEAEDASPLPVVEVASGVYVHQGRYELVAPTNGGAIANIGFVVGEKGVAVIDTGGSAEEGLRLKAAIRVKTSKPILYVINTHMHPDHVMGNAAFKDEAPFVGHYKLRRALAARGEFYLRKAVETLGAEAMSGSEIIPPTIEVQGEIDLDLGARTLHLIAYPTAHTDNDLAVLDRKTGTLFTGDLLFVRHTPALDGSLLGWLSVIETLKKIEAARAVPGHGPPSVPWPQAIAPQENYLKRLRDDVRTAIASGKTIGEAAKTIGVSEQDAWELFSEYNARNVSAAYAELEWEDMPHLQK